MAELHSPVTTGRAIRKELVLLDIIAIATLLATPL